MQLEQEIHCPTNDFKQGDSSGTCWGNGHYQCKECVFYRKDFKKLGQEFIDFAHQKQNVINIFSIKNKTK